MKERGLVMNEETRRKNLEKLMELSIKRGRIVNLTDSEIRRLFGYIYMEDGKDKNKKSYCN